MHWRDAPAVCSTELSSNTTVSNSRLFYKRFQHIHILFVRPLPPPNTPQRGGGGVLRFFKPFSFFFGPPPPTQGGGGGESGFFQNFKKFFFNPSPFPPQFRVFDGE